MGRQIRHALAEALGLEAANTDISGPTVNAEGAAVLLKTTVQGIYTMRSRGQLPRPIRARPLVWRVDDLLRSGK